MLININLISDIIGLAGVVLVLLAYFFCQIEKLPSNSLLYGITNLMGSVLILFSLIYHWNLSAFCVEIAWVFISLIGIKKAFFKVRHSSQA